MKVKYVRELADVVARDQELASTISKNPAEAIANIAADIPDNTVYRIVVGALGLTVVLTVVGTIVLIAMERPTMPAEIIAIGAAAGGALAGLLAPAPS